MPSSPIAPRLIHRGPVDGHGPSCFGSTVLAEYAGDGGLAEAIARNARDHDEADRLPSAYRSEQQQEHFE